MKQFILISNGAAHKPVIENTLEQVATMFQCDTELHQEGDSLGVLLDGVLVGPAQGYLEASLTDSGIEFTSYNEDELARFHAKNSRSSRSGDPIAEAIADSIRKLVDAQVNRPPLSNLGRR